MNIVITGATGFLGNAVVSKLLENGNHQIWIVVRPNSAHRGKLPLTDRMQMIELDLQNIDKLPDYIHEDVDLFYHFAWDGIRAPYRDDAGLQGKNYELSVKTMEACRRLGCRKFIGCGSQAEYGNMHGVITEDYPCNPNTEYGKAKCRTYQTLHEYANQNGIDFIWGRVFSIYGPGDNENTLIMSCLDRMYQNRYIPLTECIQKWDYLYIEDAADVFLQFGDGNCHGGVYNIASGKHRELKQYIETMKRMTNSESILGYGAIPYPKSGMVSFIPSISKLQRELLWSPKVSFEEGIKKMIQRKKYEEVKYRNTNL